MNELFRRLQTQCREYETRSDLQRAAPALYQRVRRLGPEAVSFCFAHMKKNRRLWDDDSLIREASKYKSRMALIIENPGLYRAIRRRKMFHLLPLPIAKRLQNKENTAT